MNQSPHEPAKDQTPPDDADGLRLEIEPVIVSAKEIEEHVHTTLPTHTGLGKAATGIRRASEKAQQVSRQLSRKIGWHRLPAAFLFLSLLGLAVWIYLQFFYASTLTVAISARDAVQLKRNASRIRVVALETAGSRENIAAINTGTADVGFVQGGVEIPDDLPRLKLDQSELILFFMRSGIESPTDVRIVMTSSEGQGSHSLAKTFFSIWRNNNVTWRHSWRQFTNEDTHELPEELDAVFVVKDPMSSSLKGTTARLRDAGFRLVEPDIGTAGMQLDFLEETSIRPGYLDPVAHLPAESVRTYSVATYLIAGQDLTPRELAAAAQLARPRNEFPSAFEPTLDTGSEMAQGVEAILGIVVYIGVAFVALLGMDIVAYRRRFNELNSLVSLISMHQSSKDVMGGTAEMRAHHVAYLSVCSDLLGLISVLTGYYSQENPSLIYNRMLEIIHERCNGLKINIQLKILHALVDLPVGKEFMHQETPAGDDQPTHDTPSDS